MKFQIPIYKYILAFLPILAHRESSSMQYHMIFPLLSFLGIVGVEIRKMKVPSEVESGTAPYVILDCDYDLAESESHQVDVKWFFRDDPQPFYQWLPGRPPQAIGDLFKNRIDLSHTVEGSDR